MKNLLTAKALAMVTTVAVLAATPLYAADQGRSRSAAGTVAEGDVVVSAVGESDAGAPLGPSSEDASLVAPPSHLVTTPAEGCPNLALGTLGTCTGPNCLTFSTNSTTRPFRDGVASSCAIPQTCPGSSAATGLPKIYDVYTFNLPSDCLCVTATYNSGTCGTSVLQVYPFAYFGEVTPFTTYPATCLPGLTYAGENGGSPIVLNTNFVMGIPVPAGSVNPLSLVVGQSGTTTQPGGCTYSWSFTCDPLKGDLTCALRPITTALEALEMKLDGPATSE